MRSVSFCLLLAACGSSSDAGPDALTPDGAPDSSVVRERAGYVQVTEDRWVGPEDAGGGEWLSGQLAVRFFDGREPSFHREAMRAGDCVLRTFAIASCTPACTNGLCVAPDVCEPYPTYVSAGRLTITGLTTAVQIDPMQDWYYPNQPLPSELFADDATITASLAGGTIPGFDVTAGGVRAITPDITGGKLVAPYPATEALVVRWTPTGGDERVRLTLNSNNRGHGAPVDAMIECDVADSAGQIAVAPALLDAFPATEAWTICAGTDCPPSKLARYRRAAALVGERELELVIASSFSFGIEHRLP